MIWSENDTRRIAEQIANLDNAVEASAAVMAAMCGVMAHFQGLDFTKQALESIREQVGVNIAVPPNRQPQAAAFNPLAKMNGNGEGHEG